MTDRAIVEPLIELDLSFELPAENLAYDEALLVEHQRAHDRWERGEGERPPELLRFWESPVPFVVMGVAGKVAEEVFEERCRERGISVLRRASGGGTVVQGPGCLNYALILCTERRPELRNFTRSYREILGRVATAVGEGAPAGISDLATDGVKFSGNAQKRKRTSLLHHGTLLYDFALDTIEGVLPEPAVRPDYRGERPHRGFVRNLDRSPNQLRSGLAAAWDARPGAVPFVDADSTMVELIEEKYGNREWTHRF